MYFYVLTEISSSSLLFRPTSCCNFAPLLCRGSRTFSYSVLLCQALLLLSVWNLDLWTIYFSNRKLLLFSTLSTIIPIKTMQKMFNNVRQRLTAPSSNALKYDVRNVTGVQLNPETILYLFSHIVWIVRHISIWRWQYGKIVWNFEFDILCQCCRPKKTLIKMKEIEFQYAVL